MLDPDFGSASAPPTAPDSRRTTAVEARNRSRRTPGIANSPFRDGDEVIAKLLRRLVTIGLVLNLVIFTKPNPIYGAKSNIRAYLT
jgi:hypothetical protein